MMRRLLTMLSLMLAGLVFHANAQDASQTEEPDLENMLYLDLPSGRVTIKMFENLAPKHIERIKTLTRQGFYDGLIFHRVIEGFMAQTGDPTGTGSGGSDLPDLEAEFSRMPHLRGTVSMARTDEVNSANSQFFIMFQPRFALDGDYTIWGRVIDGMEHVDAINRGEPPAEPTQIVKMRIAADVQGTEEETYQPEVEAETPDTAQATHQ